MIKGKFEDSLLKISRLIIRTLEDFVLTKRFEEAMGYAFELHQGQYRRGTKIPYIAHLLAVTGLVIEDGGDEDLAIAALLHDAVEDQGGQPILEKIKQRYGKRVASIVAGCTDSFSSPKPSWRHRKEGYLQHLEVAPVEIKRVSLADKIHNARSILFDLRSSGAEIWKRFNGGKSGTIWYYRSLVDVFQEDKFSPMVDELERIVEEIERLAE
jgi:(p)ppGpp synthase/HD superfamily hydrolase